MSWQLRRMTLSEDGREDGARLDLGSSAFVSCLLKSCLPVVLIKIRLY